VPVQDGETLMDLFLRIEERTKPIDPSHGRSGRLGTSYESVLAPIVQLCVASNFHIGENVGMPWFWRIETANSRIQPMDVSKFDRLSFTDVLWSSSSTPLRANEMIYIEYRGNRSLAWDSHHARNCHVGWSAWWRRQSPSSDGWFSFNEMFQHKKVHSVQRTVDAVFTVPSDQPTSRSSRILQHVHLMYRLRCPLECIDISSPVHCKWLTVLGPGEDLSLGSASLTGCFVFYPTVSDDAVDRLMSPMVVPPAVQLNWYQPMVLRDGDGDIDLTCDEVL